MTLTCAGVILIYSIVKILIMFLFVFALTTFKYFSYHNCNQIPKVMLLFQLNKNWYAICTTLVLCYNVMKYSCDVRYVRERSRREDPDEEVLLDPGVHRGGNHRVLAGLNPGTYTWNIHNTSHKRIQWRGRGHSHLCFINRYARVHFQNHREISYTHSKAKSWTRHWVLFKKSIIQLVSCMFKSDESDQWWILDLTLGGAWTLSTVGGG